MTKHKALENLNPDLCFLCQERSPEFLVIRGRLGYKLCKDCKDLVIEETRIRNKIKRVLYAQDSRNIFQQVLGMDMTPVEFIIKEISR